MENTNFEQSNNNDSIDNKIIEMCKEGGKLAAIKICIDAKKLTLFEATKYVEKLIIDNKIEVKSFPLKKVIIGLGICFWIIFIGYNLTSPSKESTSSDPKITKERLRLDSIEQAQVVENAKREIAQEEIEAKKYNKTKAGKINKKHPDWSKEDCKKIADNEIWIGMSYGMLVYMRGNPNQINTSNYGRGDENQACWEDYNPSCFYFNADDQIIKSYN